MFEFLDDPPAWPWGHAQPRVDESADMPGDWFRAWSAGEDGEAALPSTALVSAAREMQVDQESHHTDPSGDASVDGTWGEWLEPPGRSDPEG